jgi:O-antigen/teichoic acid export membrane protein
MNIDLGAIMFNTSSSLPHTRGRGDIQSSESDRNIITAAKGGGIAFIGTLLSYAFSFVFGVVIARLLGAERLGLYMLSLTITGIVASISFVGLNGGMDRYIPIFRKRRDEAGLWGVIQIGTGVPGLVSLILTLVLLLIAEPLANWVGEPAILPVLRLATLTIPVAVLTSCLSAITQGFKQLQYDVYTQAITFNLIKLMLSVVLLMLGLGVMGVMIAYVVATIIALVMTLYFAHRLFPLNRPFNTSRRDFREIFRFSFPLYLSRLLNQFGGSFETLVLGFLGIVADVGVYSTILRLSAIGNMFFSALRKISIPLISELYSQGKYEELARLYQTTTKWTLTFNLPIFLTFVAFSRPLLSIFGQDFTVGAAGLIVLAAAALFNASTGACGTVINMTGHSKVSLVNSIVYLLTTIALDFLLIPRWHLMGAAVAGGLTIVVNNTLRMIEVYILIHGLLPFNWSFLKLVAASLTSAGLTSLLTRYFLIDTPFLQMLILAPIMWAFYVAVILMLRLSDEDRLILSKLRGRLQWKRI